jgi:cell division protease FtsH
MLGKLLIISSVFAVFVASFTNNNVGKMRVSSISYSRKDKDYHHLDDKNIESIKRLERMFYLKNQRYAPYVNPKYKRNETESQILINTTVAEIIKNIKTELFHSYHELSLEDQNSHNGFYEDEDPEDYSDIEDEEDEDEKAEPFQPSKRRDQGFLDDMGVFRYSNPTLFIPVNGGGRNQKRGQSSNDEFSNENNFQIIKNTDCTFKDVGGYTKIKDELMQTADILLNPEKYKKYNVRTPKGMIFEGPPGNGKTLLARAFSGELNVSFIPVSGSEFSEKYVGVGASRVRDLFKLAQENTPCIIFIDEIDAVARKRGYDSINSNSEKDQTLNQLLISLDGFKGSNGVFVMGASNRIDLLDDAIMRPGRMDKNIYIGNPDSETRRAILEIHADGKPTGDISLETLVEMTAGFSGAQIENLLNEAMLKALREDREEINWNDLENILNRIVAGWQSVESKYSDDMINRIVMHELGHAIVGYFCEEHSKLSKVCINLLSPKSPGYTLFENNDENNNIYTKNGLFARLMVLLAGRIAEELFYGFSVTTGARQDLEEAYQLAQNMILQYGMGTQNIYPNLSDQSRYLIDQEVNSLLLLANEKSAKLIAKTKDLIIDCSIILKKDKILKPDQIAEIVERKYRIADFIFGST